MKIQLDTTAKTIKVEGIVKFSELIETLEKLLPEKEWKKFSLESNTTINNWSYPIYFQPSIPSYPWITYYNNTADTGASNLTTSGSNSLQLNAGVYNIEA